METELMRPKAALSLILNQSLNAPPGNGYTKPSQQTPAGQADTWDRKRKHSWVWRLVRRWGKNSAPTSKWGTGGTHGQRMLVFPAPRHLPASLSAALHSCPVLLFPNFTSQNSDSSPFAGLQKSAGIHPFTPPWSGFSLLHASLRNVDSNPMEGGMETVNMGNRHVHVWVIYSSFQLR